MVKIPGLEGRLETDQKTTAERKWRAPTKPSAEQKPCDVGLFSDEMDQIDLPIGARK